MLHSQGLSNNPYFELNQPNSYLFKVQSNIYQIPCLFSFAMVVPNYQSSFQTCVMFLNTQVLQCEVVSLTPNPQTEGPFLVGCPHLLIHIFAANLHI